MNIGICTHYAHTDQAYFSIRLARFFEALGCCVNIFSMRRPQRLGMPEDYSPRQNYRQKTRFTDWVRRQDKVIWTFVPQVEQITFAQRCNRTAVVVPMWHDLRPPFKRALKRADSVIALTKEAHDLFSTIHKFKNSLYIPFTPADPPIRKSEPVDPKNVKVFIPWFDYNAICANSDFLDHLSYLLERMPDASVTAAVTSSKFLPAIARRFTTINKLTGGRFTILRSVPLAARAQLFAENDLTLFPAECDNFGFCSLSSIYCGTPVLSFGLPPQTDFIQQEVNGFLVKTKIDYDVHGVPYAVPNYGKLMAMLQALISEPWHIDRMNQKIMRNQHVRQNYFMRGWKSILNI